MEKKYIKALIEKATDSGFSFLASTASIDRQGDSIDQSGWDISSYMKNPVMLWAHDYSALPVAKATNIKMGADGLTGDAEFAPAEGNPFAQQVKIMVQEGFVNALSVGFIPQERNGNIITSSELLEISFVPVPANPEALMLAAKSLTAKGFAQESVDKFIEAMKKGEEEVAPAKEEKGAVSDELDAEEAAETKWQNLDDVFDIFNAFLDVYLDEQTPATMLPNLLLEVANLLTNLANTTGTDTSTDETIVASITSLVGKSIKTGDSKQFMQKIGARHSAETKSALQEAKDHVEKATVVLAGLLENQATSNEDGNNGGDAKPDEDEKSADITVSTILEVRGMLRERTAGDQAVLKTINEFLSKKN